MLRQSPSLAALFAIIISAGNVSGQVAAPPRVGSQPSLGNAAPVKALKTWVEGRKLIDSATPGKGSVARLPTGGDVTLIFDPSLPLGTAIVLSDDAMLIGREG